jgi:ATP-dependent helicase HrpB
LSILPNKDALEALVARVNFLGGVIGDPWPRDFAAELAGRLDAWLPLSGVSRLAQIPAGELASAARSLLDWPLPRDLDRLAPASFETPAGRRAEIDYTAEGGPRVACKVQEVFGPEPHPAIAGGTTPLTIELLSPAQRPVALTRDIQAFWRGGYIDLRKDLRGRYPKHAWPEDPADSVATSRAKPRGT